MLNPSAAHGSARVQFFLGAGTTRIDTFSMHSERSIVQGSFEGGHGTWQARGGANLASYRNSTLAHDGAGFAATNAPSVGGSISSDVAVLGDAGDAFVASAWVRAQEVTADGAFCVYGLDGTVEASCQHYNVGAGAWQRVEVVLDTTTPHAFARVQVWPGAGTTRIDTAAVHKARAIHEGSFEHGGAGWQVSGSAPTTYFTVYDDANVAHDGHSFGAANSSAGGSLYQDYPAPASMTAGVASAWVRAQDVPATGTFCLYGLGTVEGTCQSFRVDASGWQQLQVVLDPSSAHTTLRVQLWLDTGTVRVDSVSVDA